MTEYIDIFLAQMANDLRTRIDTESIERIRELMLKEEAKMSVLYGSKDEAGIGEILDIL